MAVMPQERTEPDYRSLVELLPQTLFEIDAGGRFTFANRTGFECFGYRPEELAGHVSALDFFISEDRPRLRRNIQRILDGEPIAGSEYTALKKDGRTFPVIISANAIVEGGKTSGLRGVIIDITEIKRTHDLLRESEARYHDLLETMSEGFAIVNAKTVLTYVNIRLCDMLGYAFDEMVGKKVAWFLDAENKRILLENYKKRRKGGSDSYELTWTRRDGTPIATIMSPQPVHGEGGRFIGSYSVITDVTLLKKTEASLKQRERQLEDQTRFLEEANTALRVLLKKREEDKDALEERMLSNVRDLVQPYLEKLKNTRLSERQKTYLEILDAHLTELTAPFAHTLTRAFQQLTPSEIQVATLIRSGNTTKQTAEILGLSLRTVEFHRDNIRKKVGLKGCKTNLRSFLISLQ
jgi:PAS domain S-box-containing protein